MRKRLTERVDRAKQAAGGLRREISDDFKYDKKKLKHLTFVLHNVNVSLGALASALNRLSKLRGPTISPDGLLGGLGYIMPIKDMKLNLHEAVQRLSDIQDSIADEMNNPRWDASEDKEVREVLKEKEKVEEQVEEEINPEDITTSSEILDDDVDDDDTTKVASISKNAETKLAENVKRFLVQFESIA